MPTTEKTENTIIANVLTEMNDRVDYLRRKAKYDGLTMGEEVEIKTIDTYARMLDRTFRLPAIPGFDIAKAGIRERNRQKKQ